MLLTIMVGGLVRFEKTTDYGADVVLVRFGDDENAKSEHGMDASWNARASGIVSESGTTGRTCRNHVQCS